MKIEIEKDAGFCFGVVNAIEIAQKELSPDEPLYCLGDIVHNEAEIKRLEEAGIRFIDKSFLPDIKGKKLLFRAHGEHPETYRKVQSLDIQLIDATCPIVLNLQKNIRKYYEEAQKNNGQIVIFGDSGHPEAIGLKGQTGEKAIIVSQPDDIQAIDFARPVYLFSQTTKSGEQYEVLADNIRKNMKAGVSLFVKKSVCGQVANRAPKLRRFVKDFEVIIFVSGRKSSNGKYLYSVVKEVHPDTHKITSPAELQSAWFEHKKSVGISGATSTPQWLMEEVKKTIEKLCISKN